MLRKAFKRHLLPLVGHIPFRVPFEQAGLDDVQHLTGVPLPPLVLHRRSEWWKWWAEGWRTVDEERMDFIVRTSVEQRITHTPTIVVWKRWSHAYPEWGAENDPIFDLLPEFYREISWSPYRLGMSRKNGELLAAAIPKMEKLVGKLHAAGVRLLVGTDSFNPFVVPGVAMHEELRNFVEAGLTPEETWEAATRTAGETLGLEKLGALEEGAPADFLIYGKDPTVDLANLGTLEAVVSQGRIYPKKLLDEALARHFEYSRGAIYDRVTKVMARLLLWWLSGEWLKDAPVA